MKRPFLSLALLALVPAASCVFIVDGEGEWDWGSGFHHGPRYHGSGVLGTQERDVADFSGLTLETWARVEITVGDAPSLRLEGDDNLLSHVQTAMHGSNLVIDMERGSFDWERGLKIVVTTPHLTRVSIHGSGNVTATGVDAERFSAAISGSGDLSVVGRTGHLEASISGSGDLRLRGLEAATVSVSISGSGDVRVHATDELQVSISGSGDVRYTGDPRVRKGISGSGSVRRE
ncbi:MAG: DUF2807 domain-containing protein [Planctomycetota bacterium]|nr:DUF2807 domain-containing protein [Planctomycetota bacterium]